jgi:hypothetical protein
MTSKDCIICKKTLGSIRSYNSHIKSKKHLEKNNLQIEEDNKNNELIIKIFQDWDKDNWDDIIKKYIVKLKLTAKQFTTSFYRVLGGIINEEHSHDKDKAITLILKISSLYNKEIPEWINIPRQSNKNNIRTDNNPYISSTMILDTKINSIIDMELMHVINQLSDITNIESNKSALLMMNKQNTDESPDIILNEIKKFVILSHNKTIIELMKVVDVASQFMKHQIEYELYTKYGKTATTDQVQQTLHTYKQLFPQLVNFNTTKN